MGNDRENPNSKDADFYVTRDKEQLGENREPIDTADDDDEPTLRITSVPSGGKRDSYL